MTEQLSLSLGKIWSQEKMWASVRWDLILCLCLVAQLCPTLCNPMDCSPPGSSLCGNSPGKNTGVGSCSPPGPPPGDLPNPGIKCRSPTLQGDSLPAEPPGKPKNTGVGSLSLHQGIFLTQESNWGLLHCRWILYQLSYQGYVCANTKCGEGEVMLVFLL